MMQTVHDLFRTEAALLVTCRNCGHASKISPVLLRERFGVWKCLTELKWRCTACDGRNVRLGIGADGMAEVPRRQPGRLV